jgi:hypothetical protein
MLGFFLSVFRLVGLLMSGHGGIAIENAALRLQLAAFQRKRKRPVLTSFDRLFWVGLSLIWNRWRAALVYVRPDTVVDPEREASQENPGLIFRLLPWIEDPFGPRQAMSDSSAGIEYRQDHRDPATRRSASPL